MRKRFFAVLLCAALWMCAVLTPVRAEEAPIDLDMTEVSGTIAYTLVYSMQNKPQDYMGQRIKLRGEFNYFRDASSGQEFFAAIIRDATACCKQGIEFVLSGEHHYPEDYPEPGTQITVIGTFGSYEEFGNVYVQLTDAEMSWVGQ